MRPLSAWARDGQATVASRRSLSISAGLKIREELI
jgi:hypothetical protein